MSEIEEYCIVGENKIKNKICKTFVLSVLAGMFIALAGAASVYASYMVNNPSIAKIISGLVFPLGLCLVVLMKTELFTGNSLLIIPLINKKIKIPNIIKNWIIVYIGNLIGSIIISLIIYYGGLYNNNILSSAFVSIMNNKLSLSFTNAFLLGMLCNILVCIAVFLGVTSKSKSEKVLLIYMPIFLFIVLGLEHSVANMFYLSIGYLIKTVSIMDIFLINLLPVTLGNIFGGVLIGITINYMCNNNIKHLKK